MYLLVILLDYFSLKYWIDGTFYLNMDDITLGFPYSFKGFCASRNLCYIWAYLTQLFAVAVIGWSESQCFEEYFARSVQCTMGLTKCKQTAVKTSNMAAASIMQHKNACCFVVFQQFYLFTEIYTSETSRSMSFTCCGEKDPADIGTQYVK